MAPEVSIHSNDEGLDQAVQHLGRGLRRGYGHLAQPFEQGDCRGFRIVLGEEQVFADLPSAPPVVSVNSMLATGVEPSEDLLAYLLDLNRQMVFGGAGLRIGSAVRIRYDDGAQRTIVLGKDGTSNPALGIVAANSPLGAALLRAVPQVGDTVEFAAGRRRHVVVLAVECPTF